MSGSWEGDRWSECSSDTDDDITTESTTENKKWWERWLQTDRALVCGLILNEQFLEINKRLKSADLTEEQSRLFDKEEKCNILEHESIMIRDDRTNILDKQEGMTVEVKNCIREMMLLLKKNYEYGISRIISGNWDIYSEEKQF